MHADELELEVRRHTSCERHTWQYDRWTWQFEGGRCINDEVGKGQQGNWTSKPSPHLSLGSDYINYVPDNIATENAVAVAFQWAATEIDEPSRKVFTHPWIEAGSFPQQDEPLVDSPPPVLSEEAKERVNTWRLRCEDGTILRS